MNEHEQSLRAWAIVTLGAAALSACSGKVTGAEMGRDEAEVINGTPVADADNPGAVAVYHKYIRPCSGTLIRPSWVLTARHCVTTDGEVGGPLRPANDITIARGASPGLQPPATGTSVGIQIVDRPGPFDVALVKIWPDMAPPFVGLWNGDTPALQGQTVRAMGYGRLVMGDYTVEDGMSGAGTLRKADLTVTNASTFNFDLVTNAGGQITWHGDSGGPSFRLTDSFGRNLIGVAGIHQHDAAAGSTDGSVAGNRAWIKAAMLVRGDFDGNRKSDIALTGAPGWSSIPLALLPTSTGGIQTPNQPLADFPGWAALSGAKPVSGDFNGDGKNDIALTGVSGWSSIPIAFANGLGNFSVSNRTVVNFPGWAALPGAKALGGDFNGDGRGDIALTGVVGFGSVPIALSAGNNGSFTVLNVNLDQFPGWATLPNAKPLTGDFDGDGRDDIALTGVSGWTSVPVAFSNGDGSFMGRNLPLANFPGWAALAGAKAVTGDFNGDGRDDIALSGVVGFGSIPVALSNGDGTFTVKNETVSDFPAWATMAGAKLVSGDFDGDLKDDLALTGVTGWGSIPIAFSIGNGHFSVANPGVDNFPALASTAGAKALSKSQGL